MSRGACRRLRAAGVLTSSTMFGANTIAATTLYPGIAPDIQAPGNNEICDHTIFADFLIVSAARKMLSIPVFAVLVSAAVASQVILTLFVRRHAGNYCLANRGDADVAGVVDGNNAH
jgi:hypothetical protein